MTVFVNKLCFIGLCFQLSNIQLPTGRKFTFMYDEQSGLRHIVLPSGTRHSFSAQPSFGFIRYTYTLPGSSHPYLQHYTAAGGLLQTVFPGGKWFIDGCFFRYSLVSSRL